MNVNLTEQPHMGNIHSNYTEYSDLNTTMIYDSCCVSSGVHNTYMECECPMLVCHVQIHCVKLCHNYH